MRFKLETEDQHSNQPSYAPVREAEINGKYILPKQLSVTR